jgi:proteasome lid subunit RPN8/RPN11
VFQSIVRRSVVDAIRVHADEHPGIEVCGVLVGTVYENPQAAFVYIDGMIRGDGSSGRSTQVTFTAETWQHVHRVMEDRHPGKRIIGWYHTHPGFGIFLSEMDLFIQRHFFNAAWQVAFVLDPTSRESGMFAWRQAQVRRVDYVVDDESAGSRRRRCSSRCRR